MGASNNSEIECTSIIHNEGGGVYDPKLGIWYWPIEIIDTPAEEETPEAIALLTLA